MAEGELTTGSHLWQWRREKGDVQRVSRPRMFRWVLTLAVVATYVLIVLGGIVRVTDSGLGCPDWPLCHGQVIPPMHPAALIEYAHRLVTTAVAPLILGTAALAWRWYRHRATILFPSLMAVVLLGGQIALGAITVLTELHQGIVSVHLGNAMLILGLLLVIRTQISGGTALALPRERSKGYRNLVLTTAGAAFGLIVVGALVRGTGAGAVCRGFPACGAVLLPSNPLARLHMLHRAIAVVLVLLVSAVVIWTWREFPGSWALKMAAGFAGFVTMSQFGVGVAQVTIGLLPALRALHLGLATALWGSLVVHSVLAIRAQRIAGDERSLPGGLSSAHAVGD